LKFVATVATSGCVKFFQLCKFFLKTTQFLTYFASLYTAKGKLSSYLLKNFHILFNFNQITDNDAFSLFIAGKNSLDLRIFSA